MSNKQSLAQFYTPTDLARMACKLLRNHGHTLEPAAGSGALVRAARGVSHTSIIVAVEVDAEQAKLIEGTDKVVVRDFFELSTNVKFDSVVMNPPFLANRKIPESTKALPLFKEAENALGKYANLYALFLWKAYQHLKDGGEIVAIVPREVFNATGNAVLNTLLHENGTFTDVIRFNKTPFSEVSPDIVVFRWQKGNFSYETKVEVV